jgi:hypothetical protein
MLTFETGDYEQENTHKLFSSISHNINHRGV